MGIYHTLLYITYTCVVYREELEEQAEEMQVMYDRRMELLQKSMKKEFNRKRRRVATREEDDEEERESRGIEAQLRDTIARLEEELETKREKSETSINNVQC